MATCGTLYTYTLLRLLTYVGILNTIGGAYCLKAKAAIQAKPMAVPVQGRVV